MSCMAYIKTYWPSLIARWAAFTAIGLGIAFFAGEDMRTIWPVVLLGAGVVNIGWIWVA